MKNVFDPNYEDDIEQIVDPLMLKNTGIYEQSTATPGMSEHVPSDARKVLWHFLQIAKGNDPQLNHKQLIHNLDKISSLTKGLAEIVKAYPTDANQNFICNLFNEFSKGKSIPGVR